jgi:AraC family transcriptional regulator
MTTGKTQYPRGSLWDRRAENREALKVIPESAGPRVATERGGVAYSIRPPGSETIQPGSHFAAIMLDRCHGFEASIGDDRRPSFDAPVGMILVNPAGWESTISWRSRREEIVIVIKEDRLLEVAEELGVGSIEIKPPPLGSIDLAALGIARIMKAEFEHGHYNDLYFDSLLTVFSLHLIRKYSSAAGTFLQVKGGLSEKRRKAVLGYMRENLARKISVAELASLCSLSPSHFLHSFTRTFGEPPYKLLIKMRLDLAIKLLRESSHSLGEIAFHCGFSSQSHLTAAMRRYKNLTPRQIRSKS